MPKGLCFRCEHRARFLEMGDRPRYECGNVESCMHGCYMYLPVKPVILKQDEDDNRPQFGPVWFSSRSRYVGLPNMKLSLKHSDSGNLLYWDLL